MRIPLFPLNVVLFPGSFLPLHIFEERYKTMVSECIAEGREFGINLFEGQELHSVGCTATVHKITKRYDDGRMDIVVEGKRRYTLLNLFDKAAAFYHGEVVFFEDRQEPVDDMARHEAIRLYNEFVGRAFKGTVEALEGKAFVPAISFFLVQKSGLEPKERQHVLELRSENERLEYLIRHLEKAIPGLEQKERAAAVIMNDGYLPSPNS